MVIFGASGDLTKRKLMPALYALYKRQRLQEGFSILGVSRTAYTDEEYQKYILEQLHTFIVKEEQDEALIRSFIICRLTRQRSKAIAY